MADNKLLKEALEAIRSGNRAHAKDLLTRLLRADQKIAKYWLYMSAVVDTDKERIVCLENAKKIEPDNQIAARGLVLMGAMEADSSFDPVKPNSQREWDIGDVLSSSGASTLVVADQEQVDVKPSRVLGMLMVTLVAITLLFIGVTGDPIERATGRSVSSGGGLQPLITAGPSPTYLPTETPIGFVASPTGSGFNAPLEATYTPTPPFIDTPHPDSQAFSSGIRNMNEGDFEEAIGYFEQFLEVEPGSPDGHYYLGVTYLKMEDFLKARESFISTLEFDDRFGPAYLGRAQADLGLNPERQVSDDINRAISFSPEFIDGHLFRAIYRIDRDNPEGAMGDAEKALELNPASALAFQIIAQIHLQNEDFEDALEAAQTSYELDITLVDNYYTLGYALIENGYEADAVAPLRAYLDLNDEHAFGWYLLGRGQVAQEDYETALTSLEKALSLNINLVETSYYRGIAYLELEDYENAIDRLENAVRIYPRWFEAHLTLGRAILESGDTTGGYFQINKSSSFARSDAQFGGLYYYRALSLKELDRPEEARKDWEALLDLPVDAVPSEWIVTAQENYRGSFPTSTANPAVPTRVLSATPSPTP